MTDSPVFRSGLRRLLYPPIVGTLSAGEEKSDQLDEIFSRLDLQLADQLALPTAQRTLAGRFVDVASGEVVVEQLDVEIPGVIPFRWSRFWRSNQLAAGPLGNGWRHSYDYLLLEDRRSHQVVIRLPDNRGIVFPLLAEGESFIHRSEKLRLSCDQDGYYVDGTDGLRYRFAQNPSGSFCRLVSVGKSGVSYRLQFSYTSTGQLRRMSDDFMRVIDIVMDPQHRISRLEISLPNQKRQTLAAYRYDEAHDLQEVVLYNQSGYQYRYRQHRLIRLTDAMRQSTYFTYEKIGSQFVCADLSGEKSQDVIQFQYVFDEGRTQLTDSLGGVRQYVHEGGAVHRFMSAGGRQRVWFFSEYGELLSEQDALGNTSFFTYDDQGNMTQASWADGGKMQVQYNDNGLLIAMTDRAGGFWQWTYDEADRLLLCIDPAGAETRFTYDQTGLLVEMEQANEQRTQWTYDAHGNQTTQLASTGSQISWTYDFLGQLISVTPSDGRKLNIMPTTHKQVPINQASKHVETDVYQPTYDADHQLIRLRRTNRLNWQFIRDAAGRVREYTRPDGCSTHFHYDAAGRLTEVLCSDGSWYHYAYRPDGWLVEAATSTSLVQFERDTFGRILTETTALCTLQTEYDKAGRRISWQSSEQAGIRYEYDQQGHLRHLQASQGKVQFAYDRLGRLTEQLMPGGLRSRWYYDLGVLPVSHQLFWGISLQAARSQQYSWVQQQLMRLQDNRFGSVTLQYDRFGEITEAVGSAGWTERWAADRSHYQQLLLKPATETVDVGWQVVTVGVARFYYDAEGYLREKRVSGQVWQFNWHESGLLQQVTRPDGQVITFGYDALGRRTEKKVGDYQIRWAWSAHQLVHEWHQPPGSDPVALTWYMTPEGKPALLQIGAQPYSLACNYIGQPLSMHDLQGEPVWEWQWCLFGKKRNLAGPHAWHTFLGPGQYEDKEVGLVYANFHYYDATTGLPLSPEYSSPAGWARAGWALPHAPESYLSAARYIRAY